MKPIIIALLLTAFAAGCARDRQLAVGGLGSGSQTAKGSATVAAEDSDFAREACQSGAAQTEIGKSAARNTKNEAVRSFARTLAEDHAKAERELAQLFSRKGIQPESELARPLQNSLERLARLKGRQFDAAFKEEVIENHEKAMALFEKQAGQGTDQELKAFAQKRLPQLREHLETARGLPISSDTKGPPTDSANAVLSNPATRGLTVPR